MTHRERVLAALNFEETDRVPIDFGGTVNSSIVKEAYDSLKNYFGIEKPDVELQAPTRVVHVDKEILKRFDVDTRTVTLWAPRIAGEGVLNKERYTDMWGVDRVRTPGSYYFEIPAPPLGGEMTPSDISGYLWPDPDDPIHLQGLREDAEWVRDNTDCALILYVPPPFIHISQYLRGMEEWFTDFILNPRCMELLFDRILEINSEIAKRVLCEVGHLADVVTCSDDIGGQNGLLISRDHYERFIKPRHKKYFELIHSECEAKLLFHTCGDVSTIIDDLIEIGVDALNPVQVSASNMDPDSLKSKYRNRIVFWGGIDTVQLLPRGSVEEVKEGVEKAIRIFGEGGGYVLAAVHNIQPDVPAENIIAMFDHAGSQHI